MSTATLQNIPLPRNYDPPPNAKPGTSGYTWFPLDFLVPYVISGRIDGLEFKALILIQARLAEQGKAQVPISPAHFVFALRKCWRTCSTVLHRLSRKGFVNMDRDQEGDGRCWTYGWKPRAFDRDRIQGLELIPIQAKPPKPKRNIGHIQPEEEFSIGDCAIECIENYSAAIAAEAKAPEPAPPFSAEIKKKHITTTLANDTFTGDACDPAHSEGQKTPRKSGQPCSDALSLAEIRSWNCARQGCIILQLREHPLFQVELPPPVPFEKHQEIALRSVDLGMQAPDRHLTYRIAAKFPADWSGEKIAQNLVKFPGQQGPGLWAIKERAELEFEAARQSVISAWPGMSEKEAQRAAKWDRLERLAQLADEEDERRRRSAAND